LIRSGDWPERIRRTICCTNDSRPPARVRTGFGFPFGFRLRDGGLRGPVPAGGFFPRD
jgi:hypothetical protein